MAEIKVEYLKTNESVIVIQINGKKEALPSKKN